MYPPTDCDDPAGLAEVFAARGLGEREDIEKQANRHAYAYASATSPLNFSHDWLKASEGSQGVEGGWSREIVKDESPARLQLFEKAPSTIAAYILAMSPAELVYKLEQDTGAMLACMRRAGLESWHGQCSRLNAIAGGRFSEEGPRVLYAGSELAAQDLFCFYAARGHLNTLSNASEDEHSRFVNLAVRKATDIAAARPWLPRYAEYCARNGQWLAWDRARVLTRPEESELSMIHADPIWQPVPGFPDAPEASHTYLSSLTRPLDIFQRTRDGRPPLSADTALSFDEGYLYAKGLAQPPGQKWYVVFAGKQIGIFSNDEDARKEYTNVSLAIHCAYRTELDAQRAFQLAWLLGEVKILVGGAA